MTFTQTAVTLNDGNSAPKLFLSFTDGTNYVLAHSALDATGAIVSPATSTLQTAANSSLSAIAVSTANLAAATIPTNASGPTLTRATGSLIYASGQLVANSATAGSVTPIAIPVSYSNGVASTLVRVRLQKSSTSVTTASFRIHLYSVSPTCTNGDGGVWLTNSSAAYAGSFDVTIDKAMSDGAVGIGLPTIGTSLTVTPQTGTNVIYALIEARSAYAATSAETFTVTFDVQR